MRTIKITTAFILAVGLLVGSGIGAAAQDEDAAAEVTAFTGVFSPEGEELPVETTSVALPNGFIEGKPGFAWSNRLESTDPRLTGDHSVVVNWAHDSVGFGAWETGSKPNLVLSSAHVLTNDGGSWVGDGRSFSSTELDFTSGDFITFVGRGGYEGLTAYALIDGTREPPTVSGVIFPTAMPETPEPYTGE